MLAMIFDVWQCVAHNSHDIKKCHADDDSSFYGHYTLSAVVKV